MTTYTAPKTQNEDSVAYNKAKEGVTYRPTSNTEGCIVLGMKGSKPANVYTTRYKIDHRHQRQGLTQNLVKETFAPCCMEENRVSIGRILWTAIACETFLFSLHLVVLGLGVSKQVLEYRDVAPELELLHSSIETFATCLQILIRTVRCSCWV